MLSLKYREFLQQLNVEVNVFQRLFANEMKRCDNMKRQLRHITVRSSQSSLNFSIAIGFNYYIKNLDCPTFIGFRCSAVSTQNVFI